MAGDSEQRDAAVQAAPAETDAVTKEVSKAVTKDDIKEATSAAPTSPARSDKSSESEGKPVREKLKETTLDAQAAQDSAPLSDQDMKDAPNGSAKRDAQSPSGSDSERGRTLKKKRSREDFEEDDELEKQPEKKLEHDKTERHHTRKRSRDVKDIENGPPYKPATNPVSRIEEADTEMTSPAKDRSKGTTSSLDSGTDTSTSPKNKRTREQAETAGEDAANTTTANGKPVSSTEDERDSKRPRDLSEAQSEEASTEAKNKIPPGSGFANTSAASPFAAMAPKPRDSKKPESEALPQTSDDKFKASGFGSFASAEKSPFGGLASPGSSSPFGAAGGNKMSSFAGSKSPSATNGGGFASLGSSTKSSFGSSTFGSALGGGFGALTGSKPGLTSFATPSDLTIKGLKAKPSAFGTPADQDKSDESDDDDAGDEEENEKDDNDEERKSSQPLLSQQPQETGEEDEYTTWTGRAKLYTMAGEGKSKGWKERGVGNFKLNLTLDQPRKARFVLRADGTHRLLLNAAVTKQFKFGESNGEKPKDGRLLFNTPTPSGELEMHLLKLKAERAIELWEEVNKVKDSEL